MERITITLLIVPSIIMMTWQLYNTLIYRGFRAIYLVVLAVGFIAMSQTIEPTDDDPNKIVIEQWFSIDGSWGAGNYDVEVYNCSGKLIDSYTRKCQVWSVGAAYHFKPKANHHLTSGMHLFSVSEITSRAEYSDYSSLGIHPYISYEMRHFGAGLGLNALFGTYQYNSVLPAGYLRAGPKDVIYADIRVLNDFYLAGLPTFFQIGIGSGFGNTDRSCIRIGYFGNDYEGGLFASGELLIKKDVTIKYNLSVGEHFNGAVGLQWHIGKNRWGSKMANNPSTVDKK